MLHQLLPPVIQSVTLSPTTLAAAKSVWKKTQGQNKRIKFSIADSFLSMVMICKYPDKPIEKLKSYAKEKHTKQIHFHPLIVVFENNKEELKYFVYYNSIKLSANSFIDALQLLLKIFLTLDFKYPVESSHICNFLSHFFFDVELQQIPGVTIVKKFMTLLK